MVYLLKEINTKMDEQKLNYSTSQAEVKMQMEEQFKAINSKLEDIPTKYVTKDEHKTSIDDVKTSQEKTNTGFQKGIDGINSTLSRINWMIITAVIAEILGFIFMKQIKF